MTDDDMSNDADHLIDRSARLLDHEVSRIDRSLRDRMSSAVEMQAIVSSQARRRELELQLQKIRSEALAARLDAKAAEIELMIRRLSAESPVTESASPPSEPRQPSWRNVSQTDAILDSGGPAVGSPETDRSSADAPVVFEDWNAVRNAMALRFDAPQVPDEQAGCDPMLRSRLDTAHLVPKHHFDAAPELASDTEPQEGSRLDSVMTGDMQIDAQLDIDDEERPKRSRPAAWLVSVLTHVAILVLLAAVGLTQHRPKDQVALTASAPSSEQVSMETFEIEASEPQTDPKLNQPNPSEIQYDLSPVGDISAAEMITDSPAAAASSSMSAILSGSNSSASPLSMKPNPDATMEFCGVKGGGNHFVYLVDSSGSMGDAFDSARAELLRSIDLLKAEQRFYVIFFDAEPDYMRLTDANVDEPRSVNATRVNRDALKRWAMRINKDRGRAPYDALRFALTLRPDVIFLLSDGEFPQGIEDLLREENRIINLFGDDDPISVIHTIGYHSKEGESRMKRIAQQNQGMYRYVPKP